MPCTMQVTISLLPASLSLVHIPRSRLHQLSHPVLKQILQPNPTFLNITCNEVELSLFADETMLEDFEPVSRRDRQRQRSLSNSGSTRRSSRTREIVDPVEVSYEKWRVLQVDDHSERMDNSGIRVNEISAPLAAASISILYQSSYTSDFIFVKESRLKEAMNLLAAAGFEIYSFNTDPIPIYPTHFHDDPFDPIMSPTSDITSIGSESEIAPNTVEINAKSLVNDFRDLSEVTNTLETTFAPSLRKSCSPTAGEVHLLPSDLACVGLSDELGADHWSLKIVKLVAFPELITSPHLPSSFAPPFISNPRYLQMPSPLFELPALNSKLSPISSSSTSESVSDDDGYFSHSPQTKSHASVVTLSSRSHPNLRDLPGLRSAYKHYSRHFNQGLSSVSPTKNQTPKCVPAGQTISESGSRVPFFSYTRTTEGSSLTADVYILSTLFPAHERHMVICGGELDAADSRLTSGLESPDHYTDDCEDSESEDDFSQGSILKCLQIDLQRFGLDKYGLVNRFSQVLKENGINHMYSSTFKTANLLVDKRHARRAQTLLCSC